MTNYLKQYLDLEDELFLWREQHPEDTPEEDAITDGMEETWKHLEEWETRLLETLPRDSNGKPIYIQWAGRSKPIPRLSGISSLPELLASLCKHPKNWVLRGTFEEVGAYLQGFVRGLDQYNPGVAAKWFEFERWLPHRLRYPRNYGWVGELRRRFPDDQEALEQLRLLFEEYTAQKEEKPPDDTSST